MRKKSTIRKKSKINEIFKKKATIRLILLFTIVSIIFSIANATPAQTPQYTDKTILLTPAPVVSHGLNNASASVTKNTSASKIKVVNMHINTDMSLIHTKNISISKVTLKFPKIKATKMKVYNVKPIRMQSNFRMPHFKI